MKRTVSWLPCIVVLALVACTLPLTLLAPPARAATLGWYPLSRISSTSTIADATFLDAQSGWAVGSNGGLFVTHDGAHTWSTVVTGISDNLNWISFADGQNGYAAGDSVLLHTVNGGTTWQQLRLPSTTNHLSSLSTPAGGPVFVVATPDVGPDGVYESTDSGVSWQNVFTGTVSTVAFVSAATGFAVGNGGVYRTTDGGSTWQTIFNDGAYDAIGFVSPAVGYVAAGAGSIDRLLRTADGGATWNQVFAPSSGDCGSGLTCHFSFSFLSPTQRLFGYTTDGGSPASEIQATGDGAASWQDQLDFQGSGARVVGHLGTTPYAIIDHDVYYYGYPVPPPTATAPPANTPVPSVTTTQPSMTPSTTKSTTNGCQAGSLKQVVACAEPSVLRVDVHVSDGEVQGTAFVVRSDSAGTYLLTNRHVIEGATPDQTRVIAPDGKTSYPVLAILANDAKSGTAGDLAVIKIRPTALRPLAFADMSDVAAGETVASIGYGMAFQLAGPASVTEGVVSAVGRDLGDGFGPVWIQHQSAVNQGNSGGPLLDMEGHVVGVNTLSMDQLASGQSAQGMFFAIPANLAQSTAARLSAQIQRPTTTLLRATQPRASRVGTAFYTLTLPAGWISSRLSRSQPVLISRNQLVQVQLGTSATRQRPSTVGLRQMISRLASKVGKVKSLTFSAATVGRLHGVSGTATYARKPYRLVVVALPEHSGKHVFVLAAIVHSRATAKDKQQYKAVVASLRPMR